MILSRTKIAKKHPIFSRCPSPQRKQEGTNLRKTGAQSLIGRTRLATFPQWYTCRVRPEGNTWERGSAATFQSCQFKENTRIESALCLKTMPGFDTTHTFGACRGSSRNSSFFRMVFINSCNFLQALKKNGGYRFTINFWKWLTCHYLIWRHNAEKQNDEKKKIDSSKSLI